MENSNLRGLLYEGFVEVWESVPDFLQLVTGYRDDFTRIKIENANYFVDMWLVKQPKMDYKYLGEQPYAISQIYSKSMEKLEPMNSEPNLDIVYKDICDLFETDKPPILTAQGMAEPEGAPATFENLGIERFIFGFSMYLSNNKQQDKLLIRDGYLYGGHIYRMAQIQQFLNLAYAYLQPDERKDKTVYVRLSCYPKDITLLLTGRKNPTDKLYMPYVSGAIFPSIFKKKIKIMNPDDIVDAIHRYIIRMFKKAPVTLEAYNCIDDFENLALFEPIHLNDISLDSVRKEDEKNY